MSVVATLAAALATTGAPAECSWDRPGLEPFMGDVPAAVDRYRDIPAPVRERLKERMRRHAYDDVAVITRDRISGTLAYRPELTGMFFGNGRYCSSVSRGGWNDSHRERGLVYCEDGHCVLVPTVCRNVSRVYLQAPVVPSGTPVASAPPGEIDLPPTSAGFPPGSAPPPADTPPSIGGGSPPSTGIGSSIWSAPVGGLIEAWDVAGSPDTVPSWGSPVATASGSPGVFMAPSPMVLPSPIPEPGSWLLMTLGISATIGWVRWRGRRS